MTRRKFIGDMTDEEAADDEWKFLKTVIPRADLYPSWRDLPRDLQQKVIEDGRKSRHDFRLMANELDRLAGHPLSYPDEVDDPEPSKSAQ